VSETISASPLQPHVAGRFIEHLEVGDFALKRERRQEEVAAGDVDQAGDPLGADVDFGEKADAGEGQRRRGMVRQENARAGRRA
jgi:hypothetical protein